MHCPWMGQVSDLRKDFSPHPVIEDLTHKTGNFKQFSIFCNMLESALTQVGTRSGAGWVSVPWIPGGGSPSDVCKTLFLLFH